MTPLGSNLKSEPGWTPLTSVQPLQPPSPDTHPAWTSFQMRVSRERGFLHIDTPLYHPAPLRYSSDEGSSSGLRTANCCYSWWYSDPHRKLHSFSKTKEEECLDKLSGNGDQHHKRCSCVRIFNQSESQYISAWHLGRLSTVESRASPRPLQQMLRKGHDRTRENSHEGKKRIYKEVNCQHLRKRSGESGLKHPHLPLHTLDVVSSLFKQPLKQ